MNNEKAQTFRLRSRRRAMMKSAEAFIIGLTSLLAGGCTEPQDKAHERAAPTTSAEHATTNTSSPASSLAPTPSGASSARPSQSSNAAPESLSPAGTWEGSYNAKKGSVELPAKVKDKARARDDGTTSIGAGKVSLTITPDGEISGKASGALGDATLRGKVDGEMVGASVFPDNPAAPSAMTGVLVGMFKDGVIRAEIRVSGPDATIVRESAIELKRK
jgi:hypothetical protein